MAESKDAGKASEYALEAQKLLTEAMKQGGFDYKSKYVYYGMGLTSFKRRAYDDAVRWHTKAIEIDPLFVPALVGSAESNQLMRNFPEAIVLYDKGIKNFISYYGRAGAKLAAQRPFDHKSLPRRFKVPEFLRIICRRE